MSSAWLVAGSAHGNSSSSSRFCSSGKGCVDELEAGPVSQGRGERGAGTGTLKKRWQLGGGGLAAGALTPTLCGAEDGSACVHTCGRVCV